MGKPRPNVMRRAQAACKFTLPLRPFDIWASREEIESPLGRMHTTVQTLGKGILIIKD
jgi:hypothetical protein